MPYEIGWRQEKQVLTVCIYGFTTRRELEALNRAILAYIEAGTGPVNLIQDITHLHVFPTSTLELKQIFTYLGHPKLRWSMFVGYNMLWESMFSVLSRSTGANYRMFKTLESCLEFVEKDSGGRIRSELQPCSSAVTGGIG